MLESRPVWLPTLAAVAFAALTASLGQWQWRKAELKAARQAVFDEGGRLPVLAWQEAAALGEAAFYRRVRVSGRFLAEHQVLLDNRIQDGRPGYHVIVPLELARGGVLLVNRGWLAAPADRGRVPDVATPAGDQTLEGILVHAQGRYLELGQTRESGRIWQNLDLERFRHRLGGQGGGALPDWLLLPTSPAQDGLVRDWPQPDLGIARHRAYAVQWYALCAVIAGLWVYFVVVRRRLS